MSKRITIIAGLSIILLLLGIWGYVLIYGTPEQAEEVFATFGFSREDDPSTSDTSASIPSDTLDDLSSTEGIGEEVDATTTRPALRQVTTEPVAGFTMIGGDTDTTTFDTILYAEAGTGHIHRHDITTDMRERVSNFTIAQARAAYFTSDGVYAVILSGYGNEQLLHTFALDDSNGTSTDPNITRINAQNFAVGEDTTLLYTVTQGFTTTAFAYDFQTGEDRQLFTTPLTQIKVAWGETADATHYFYPRPAAGLESRVFAVEDGVIRRTPIAGYDLNLIYQNGVLAYSFSTEANPPTNTGRLLPTERPSYASFTNELNERSLLNLTLSDDLCTISTNNVVVCALTLAQQDTPPAAERRGMYSENRKYIFAEQIDAGSAQSLINLEQTAGRAIDGTTISLFEGITTDIILFQNRRDGTLWLYDVQ